RDGADPSPLFVLHLDGVVEECAYDDDGTPYVLRTRRDCVALPSTGIKDAEGREVYEGDVLEGEPWSFADPDPLRCIVRREAWAFVLENGPAHDRDPEGTLKFIREARVVGNIYERSPSPA